MRLSRVKTSSFPIDVFFFLLIVLLGLVLPAFGAISETQPINTESTTKITQNYSQNGREKYLHDSSLAALHIRSNYEAQSEPTSVLFTANTSTLSPQPISAESKKYALLSRLIPETNSASSMLGLLARGRDSRRMFDVERIGITSFFLAIVYGALLILAAFRFSSIRKFVAVWTSEKTLYFAVLIHLSVRTLGFTVLSVFTLMDTDVWYPLLALLFTFPEYCTISIYLLIFTTFLESFIFSHEQFRILNRRYFRSKSRIAVFVASVFQYATIAVLFILLALNQDEFDDYLSIFIEWSLVILNGIFPFLAVAASMYFGMIYLAGFPVVSPVALEVVTKVKWLFAIWTIGRLCRGVFDVISLLHNWQKELGTRVLSLVIFSILTFSEFMPMLFLLDWSTVAVLLIGEDISPGSIGTDVYVDMSLGNEESNYPINISDSASHSPTSGAGVNMTSFQSEDDDVDDLRSSGIFSLDDSKNTNRRAHARFHSYDRSPLLSANSLASDFDSTTMLGEAVVGRISVIGTEISSRSTNGAGGLSAHNSSLSSASLNSTSVGVAPQARLELSDLSLPRAFFEGPIISAPVLNAAAEVSSSSSLLSRVGTQPAKQGPQVLADNGVWTTATGFINASRQKVCVKRVRLASTRHSAIEELAGEIEIRSKLPHPNIAGVLGVTHDKNCVYVIQEYVARRSLYELLRQAQRDFSPQGILRVALQAAQAMEFAHGLGVIHGHLKSRNILLDEQMNVRVSDLSIRTLKSFAEAKFGHRFFTAWTAPEVLVGYAPTKASDVYSFGAICWEMILRREPFEMLTVSELISSVGRGELRLKFPHRLLQMAQEQTNAQGRPLTVPKDDLATGNASASSGRIGEYPLPAATVPYAVFSIILRCFTKPEYRPSFTDIVQVLTRCLHQVTSQKKEPHMN